MLRLPENKTVRRRQSFICDSAHGVTKKLDGGLVVCVAMASGPREGGRSCMIWFFDPTPRNVFHKPSTNLLPRNILCRVAGLTTVPPTALCTH